MNSRSKVMYVLNVLAVAVMGILFAGIYGCDSGSDDKPTPSDGDDCSDCVDTDDDVDFVDADVDEDTDGDTEEMIEAEEETAETTETVEYPYLKWGLVVEDPGARVIAADSAGNVYEAGLFTGSFSLCDATLDAGDSAAIYLRKVSDRGECEWIQQFCTAGCTGIISDIATDSNDNLIITGSISGTTNMGGETLGSATDTSYNMFLAKLDSDGQHVWSHWYAGTDAPQYPGALAVAADGTIHVTGAMQGSVDFGGGTLTGAGENDAFVASFSAAGEHVRSFNFGDWQYQQGTGIAVDSGGNIYVSGVYMGEWTTCATTMEAFGESDMFLIKFDDTNACVWEHHYGSSGNDIPGAIALDSQGNLYMAGNTAGSLNLGGGAMPYGGASDVFAAKFAGDGSLQWSKQVGDEQNQYAVGLAVGPDDSLWLTGGYDGVMYWSSSAVLESTGSDAFLVGLDNAGVALGAWSFGSPLLHDEGWSLAADGQLKNLYAVGVFSTQEDENAEVITDTFLWCFVMQP